MSRSLPLSLLGVLTLTLVVLQGVLAFVAPGLYHIIAEKDLYLTVGQGPPIFPPPEVPARLLKQGEHLYQVWEIRRTEGGFTIRQPGDRQFTYGLIEREDAVFVSATEQPQTWAVDQAGDGLYTIGLPYEDLLFTQTPEKSLQVHLKRASGEDVQLWRLVRIDRNSRALDRLYGKSRFNSQCAM